MHVSPKTQTSRFLVATVTLLWAVIVLGLHYWVHKPITPALARATAGAALDLAVASAFVLVGGGLGRKALTGILRDLSFWSAAERAAASALVGLGVLSLALVLLGSVMLSRASVAALLIGAGAAVLRDVIGWIGDVRAAFRGGVPADRWQRTLAVIVVAIVGISLLLALLPPARWDVLTYHLAGAQQYVERGRFYAVAYNHFLGFPQLVDTLFAGQLALTGRLTGAAVIHWWTGLLLLMAAGGYAARRAGSTVGWVTAAVLITMPSLWLEMTAAYVDLMPVAYAVVAVSVIERWREAHDTGGDSSSWRYIAVVGALAGFGLGVKYSVLWLAAALGVLIVWAGRRDGARRAASYGALYSAAALVVFAPWLVRNMVWYDSPVYPLVFDAVDMDSIRRDWYSQPESGLIYSSDSWQIPVLPLTATILGLENSGPYGADIGPLYIMLLPLLPLFWRQIDPRLRKTVMYAGIVAGIILLVWWVSASVGSYISMQTRLIFYIFGPLALIASIQFEALRRLPAKPVNLYFVLRALVGLTFVFALIDAVRTANNSGATLYFSGKSDYQEHYLENALGWHYAAMRQVNALPHGSTVRFLWEPRYLYCDQDNVTCYGDSLMDGWYYARRTIDDGAPASIARAWQRAGFDYFLVYEFGRDFEQDQSQFYTPEDWRAWDQFVADYLDKLWTGGNRNDLQYVIYHWKNEARAR